MLTLQEKKLLGLLCAIQFVHIVDFMIMMPLGPQLMRLFSIDPQQFGLLVSSYSISAGLSGFLASLFIDRFGRRNVVMVFLLGFGLGTFACALAPNYGFLLFTRSLTGVFGGVLGSLVFAVVGDAIPAQRRGQGTGFVMMAFSVASIFGVPLSLYFATRFHWHSPFYILAGLSGVILVLLFKWMPKLDGHLLNSHLKSGQPKQNHMFSNINSILHNPSQMSGIVLSSCLILSQFAMIPFLSPYLVATVGMKEADLPMIYFVGGCFTIFSSPLIGRLADKYGNHKIFPIFLFASLVPILVLTHMPPIPLFFILTTTAAFFVCTSGRMIPAISMLNSTVAPAQRGSFMSLASCTQQLSMALASLLAGAIVKAGPNGELVNYNYVGYAGVVLSIAAYFVARRVKRHQTSLIAAA